MAIRPTLAPPRSPMERPLASHFPPSGSSDRLRAGGAAPAGREPSTADSSVRRPSPVSAGGSAVAGACHHGRSGAPALAGATHAAARSDSTPATTPDASRSCGASCIVDQVRRMSAATLCRSVKFTRSTKAVFSFPLKPSPRRADRSAARVPQRSMYVTPHQSPPPIAFLDLPVDQPCRHLPLARPSSDPCTHWPK